MNNPQKRIPGLMSVAMMAMASGMNGMFDGYRGTPFEITNRATGAMPKLKKKKVGNHFSYYPAKTNTRTPPAARQLLG